MRKAFAAFLLSVSACVCHAQNLVFNPSFELQDVGWVTSASFVSSIAHSGSHSMGVFCVGHSCVSTQGAGAFFSQSLALSPGQRYDLTFWVTESPGGGTSELSVFWNGNMAADILNPANNTYPNFIQLSFPNLLATSTFTSLEIHGRQDQDITGMFFDDISVTAAVPEPSAYVLMLVGLGVVEFAVRRRQRSASLA